VELAPVDEEVLAPMGAQRSEVEYMVGEPEASAQAEPERLAEPEFPELPARLVHLAPEPERPAEPEFPELPARLVHLAPEPERLAEPEFPELPARLVHLAPEPERPVLPGRLVHPVHLVQ